MTSLFRSSLVAMLALPFLLTGCQCSKDASEAPTAPVEAPIIEEAPMEEMPMEGQEAPPVEEAPAAE